MCAHSYLFKNVLENEVVFKICPFAKKAYQTPQKYSFFCTTGRCRYIYIYTSTTKGVPLCFLNLLSLRGPTTGPLIPKVMPTVNNICAGHNYIIFRYCSTLFNNLIKQPHSINHQFTPGCAAAASTGPAQDFGKRLIRCQRESLEMQLLKTHIGA